MNYEQYQAVRSCCWHRMCYVRDEIQRCDELQVDPAYWRNELVEIEESLRGLDSLQWRVDDAGELRIDEAATYARRDRVAAQFDAPHKLDAALDGLARDIVRGDAE